MIEIGNTLISEIFARWDRGIGVQETPVPPLTAKYAAVKQRRGGSALRDLKRSGKLRRGITALSANENKVTLGPINGVHTKSKRGVFSFSDVLFLNQQRARMWGVSANERVKLVRIFAGERPVKPTAVK